MKQVSAKPTRGLTQRTKCTCADNSGAKVVEIISVFGHKTRNRQFPSAGIASMVNVVVKKGSP